MDEETFYGRAMPSPLERTLFAPVQPRKRLNCPHCCTAITAAEFIAVDVVIPCDHETQPVMFDPED